MWELCPISGVGKPYHLWSPCDKRCAWCDPETNECAPLGIITALHELPLEYFNTRELVEQVHKDMDTAGKTE